MHNPEKFNLAAFDRNYEAEGLKRERFELIRQLKEQLLEKQVAEDLKRGAVQQTASQVHERSLRGKVPLTDTNSRLYLTAAAKEKKREIQANTLRAEEEHFLKFCSVHRGVALNDEAFQRLHSPSRKRWLAHSAADVTDSEAGSDA